MPEELEHLVVERGGFYAKKLGIEYAPCVTHFEIRKGRYVPVVKGIVVFKEDVQAIREASA